MSNDNKTDKVVSITEAAKLNKVTRQAIYVAIKLNKLKATKETTRWTINLSDLEDYRKQKYSRMKSVFDGELLFDNHKGYFSINPILALFLVLTMFSFVGLPPLVGFFGKQMVLTTALDNNKTILVLIGVLTSVIGAVYYLTVIKTIYFDKSEYEKTYMYLEVSLSNIYSITLSILNLAIISFIFIPDELLNLCNLLSLISYSIA